MGIARFEKNAEVRISGKSFVLKRLVEEDLWQIEEIRTGRIHEKSISELHRLYTAGELEFPDPLAEVRGKSKKEGGKVSLGKPHRTVRDELMCEAKVRATYVRALMDVPMSKRPVDAAAQKVWEKLGKPERVPHFTTLSRWRKRYIGAGQDVHAVVSREHLRGNRVSRYQNEVVAIVEQSIDTEYMTLERKTEQDTLDHAKTEVARLNKTRPAKELLKPPTRRLVHRLIGEITAFDRCAARYGHTVAVKKFRAMLGHRVTDMPLERAEIDHTLLDLLVIDDESGLPLGRPTLTVCIDDRSRCVLGVSISFQPASYLSVARCLKDAFLPKVDLRKKHKEIENEWLAHGVPRELVMDQGLEFHSVDLEEACESLGIEMHYAARKTPWFKGKVERFLGTLNRGVAHGAPGTTFSNIFQRGDYDPKKHAVVRYSVLQLIVRKWIADVYHQRPHRVLKEPPAVCWKTRIKPEDIPVPDDPSRLDAILGRRLDRVLTVKGIELEGLFYNTPELQDLRKRFGEKLDVCACVDDGDIGAIVVLYDDRMFTVPCINPKYAAGMTLWQHKVCKRYADDRMSKFDASGWLQAKYEIAELIRKEFALAKGKPSKRLGRFLHSGNEHRSVAPASTPADSPVPAMGQDSAIGPVTAPATPRAHSAPAATAAPTAAMSTASSPSNVAPAHFVVQRRNRSAPSPEQSPKE